MNFADQLKYESNVNCIKCFKVPIMYMFEMHEFKCPYKLLNKKFTKLYAHQKIQFRSIF